MANIDANDLKIQTQMAGTYGNLSVAIATITAAGLDDGDVLRFLNLPPNIRLVDGYLIHGAGGSSRTMRLGYVHEDGESGDDDAFFFAATTIAAEGRIRANAAKAPATVERRSLIVGTLAGGGVAAERDYTAVVFYEYTNR